MDNSTHTHKEDTANITILNCMLCFSSNNAASAALLDQSSLH